MEVTIDDQRLSFDSDLEVILLDVDSELLACDALGDRDVDSDLVQGLLPVILVSRASVSCIGLGTLALFILLLLFSVLDLLGCCS